MPDDVMDIDAGLEDQTGAETQETGGFEAGETTPEVPGDGVEEQQGQQQQQASPHKAVRDAIKAASQQFPEQAKYLKAAGDAYFRTETAYKAAYATPEEAVAAKNLIEGLGGVDGIGQLQERVANYEASDAALASGDPAVLDSFFKDFPDGAIALAPAYLEHLYNADPAALVAAVGPYTVGLLDNVNLAGYLNAIVNETDLGKAKAYAGQILNWYQKVAQQFAQSGQGARGGGGAAHNALTKEREQVANEREQVFVDAVRTKVNTSATPTLNAEVDKYSKMYSLNPAQKDHYSKTLEQTIVAEMNADANYKKQVDLRYSARTRTHDTVASYISAEFNRRVKEKAFEVAKGIYGAPRTKTPAADQQQRGATTTSGGKAVRVSTRPPNDQLDLDRKGADLGLIKGYGWLKRNGQLIRWRD